MPLKCATSKAHINGSGNMTYIIPENPVENTNVNSNLFP